jgi:hypothetical protein
MSDLRRILDEADDDLACRILRAAEDDDVPEPALRDRTLGALGLGGAGAGVALALKGVWKWGLAWSAWKWAGLSVVLAVGVGGVLVAPSLSDVSTAERAGATAVAPAAAPSASAPRAPETTPTASVAEMVPPPVSVFEAAPPSTPELIAAAPTGRTAAPSAPGMGVAAPALTEPQAATQTSTSPQGASSARGLAGELAALDVARAALAAGDPRRALVGADAYDRDYPHGVLGQEAAVVRIEALHALGDDVRARSLARAFLDAHPSTAHADRLRTILRSQP